jgi:hypothetical protein
MNNITNKCSTIKDEKSFCIMGAGIQGCCIALLLSKYYKNITIIEQEENIMSKSSAAQEGRVHLGFLYANDKSMKTGYKMLNDALNFSNYIEYLLDEKLDWNTIKSKKYLYLNEINSLLSEKEVDEYFEKLETKYHELISTNKSLNYLGQKPKTLYTKIKIPDYLNKDMFNVCYSTEEVGIVQNILRDKINKKLIEKNINIFFREQIVQLQKQNNKFMIETNKNKYIFDNVVNCLWENKHKFDTQINYLHEININIRLKCGVVSECIDSLKGYSSINIINGPYGDFGNFSNHNFMYFTWYPVSVIKMIIDDNNQHDSNELYKINSKLDDIEFKKQIEGHEKIFSKIFNIKNLSFVNPKVSCNAVVASGINDIKYKDSYLHNRFNDPIFYDNNYYSIQTGKYTSAPYNTYLFEKIISL